MSDYEGLEYLEPGFEPASLTVPRLRSIFVTHDITYPANAKKAQLLQIFEDEVKPKAKKILSVRARARRTSRGITDAESQDSTVTEENLEEEAMPPPPTPRTTRRKPSRLRSEEVELEPELPRARTRSPTKKLAPAKTRQTRTSDTNTSADPDAEQRTVRRVRKSEAPGAVVPVHKIKLEDSDDAPTVSKRRESAFTYDNPFQSGSSPLSESRSTSGERRRKSVGTAISTRKSTSSTRRKTDGPVPSTSAAFQIPISELESLKHVDENGVVASEEFTPEEQLEISQELAVKGVDALGPRRVKPQQRRAFNMSGPIWLAIVVLLGGYATWYSQEKFAVGYCGVGRDAVQVLPANVEVPDWLQVLVEPQCEPCPRHAQCFEKLKTECEGDYLLKQHPLALGGRIPIAPTCEPDGEKARKVKAVADKAVEELRERRAKFECGDLTTEAGLAKPTVKIDAEELKTEVSKKRSKKMGKAEFEELWAGAIGEIEGREEVTKTDDGNRTLLDSNSLARLSFSCAVKRQFRHTLAANRLVISAVIGMLSFGLYLRSAYRSRAATKALVPHLVSLTLDRLATQAHLHVQDRETFPENWISIGQLRDDVLRDQHSLSKREALWKKVRAVVEMNANVRASQRESPSTGEVSRVWEWIGAVGALESGEKRRKSGRVSWGVYDEASSPVSGTDAGPEIVRQKWEENRPIY